MKSRIIALARRHIVTLVILLIVLCVYFAAMTPQLRDVFADQSEKPIYQGADGVPAVAIQCNVYSGGEYLQPMLAILKEHNVHITFNLGGIWVRDNPALAKQLAEAGHELGNHGYAHKMHARMTLEQNVAEIQKSEQAIYEATGVRTTLFVPPSGDYNATTVRAATSIGYRTIMWSADTIDWRDHDTDVILKRATTKTKPGGMLLMHPTKNTVEALPAILDHFAAQNLKVVPVSELLAMTN
nr:polysaccharide deacetylase family protein [Maliibacterium massiliense]